MPTDLEAAFRSASEIISAAMEGIESLPLLPREVEDILAITTTERHRWLKDGRLSSAGIRTVKLRGRTKKVTFHIFDPGLVQDVLDRNLVEQWREEDAETAVENRRRAVWKRRLVGRAGSKEPAAPIKDTDGTPNLEGWAEFEREGLLR